eukprot:1144241-Pelagomonas_calceolata.AAC.3
MFNQVADHLMCKEEAYALNDKIRQNALQNLQSYTPFTPHTPAALQMPGSWPDSAVCTSTQDNKGASLFSTHLQHCRCPAVGQTVQCAPPHRTTKGQALLARTCSTADAR